MTTVAEPIQAVDHARVQRFLAGLPERDRTFVKQSTAPDSVERWCADERVRIWLLIGDDGAAQAMLAIVAGVGLSAHVHELRLIVAAPYRRRGLGRRLAHMGLLEAVRGGALKIVVEVAAEQEGDLQMFTALGFRAEALLVDHLRTRDGRVHDLVILAHDVDAVADSLHALGIDDAEGIDLRP